MKVVVIGVGYVGLVTGACFAEMGNNVICIDIDVNKIARLNCGEIPIHEPGLAMMVQSNLRQGRISFTNDFSYPLKSADIIFIAVGTPPALDGSVQLNAVLSVAKKIGEHIEKYVVIATKSTVPVGTTDRVKGIITAELSIREVEIAFDVVSNPEFLKEGSAVDDFMKPDRVIVGGDSERANHLLRDLYAPFMRNHNKLMFMGVRDAEFTKYVANAMLATKISFINEMASIAESVGVDIESVRLGIGSDPRIGYDFIYPGCGYGGSCFPKDVRALIHLAEKNAIVPLVLQAVEDRNIKQKTILFDKLQKHFNNSLQGRCIALWGLSFKPGTDDMREASSTVLIKLLLSAGAFVRVHDPVSINRAKELFKELRIDEKQITFVEDQYEALNNADALALVTEWKQYRRPDVDRMTKLLRIGACIVDGRNLFSKAMFKSSNLTYYGIGRGG